LRINDGGYLVALDLDVTSFAKEATLISRLPYALKTSFFFIDCMCVAPFK